LDSLNLETYLFSSVFTTIFSPSPMNSGTI
jgi:hypothetical protein